MNRDGRLLAEFPYIDVSNPHQVRVALFCGEAKEQMLAMHQIGIAYQLRFLQKNIVKNQNYLSRVPYVQLLAYWDYLQTKSNERFADIMKSRISTCLMSRKEKEYDPQFTKSFSKLPCCVLNNEDSIELVRQATEDGLSDMIDMNIFDFVDKNNPDAKSYAVQYQDLNGEKLRIPLIPIELTPSEDGVFTLKVLDWVETQEGPSKSERKETLQRARSERYKALQRARKKRENKQQSNETETEFLANNPLKIGNSLVNFSGFDASDFSSPDALSLSDPFLKQSKDSNDSKTEQ